MTSLKNISVLYFTDILCIWAYIAQVRMDQLENKFGEEIILKEHYFSVFGSVGQKMEQNWGAKGGVSAYNKHVQEIVSKFDHIEVHPDVWIVNTPITSGSCHLFLKALQVLEDRNELPEIIELENSTKSVVGIAAWEFRLAFFRDLIDISNFNSQMEIAERLQLPIREIQEVIESGAAFSALDSDLQLKEKYGVVGSPSLVLNEGRQIIYGNVGYRVIEANIRELLNQPENQASWC